MKLNSVSKARPAQYPSRISGLRRLGVLAGASVAISCLSCGGAQEQSHTIDDQMSEATEMVTVVESTDDHHVEYESDEDGDGIVDNDDKCEGLPEDRDNFEDEDGCPDVDNDGDSILDVDDLCPNEPENLNGIDDDDGCPDRPAGIRIMSSMIRMNQRVHFARDSSQIRPASVPILNEIVQFLQAHPEITRVEIQGHIDMLERPPTIGYERALAIRRYLKNNGVDENRLEAHGYGDNCLVGPSITEQHRSRNRRVDFRILSTTDSSHRSRSQCGPRVEPGP